MAFDTNMGVRWNKHLRGHVMARHILCASMVLALTLAGIAQTTSQSRQSECQGTPEERPFSVLVSGKISDTRVIFIDKQPALCLFVPISRDALSGRVPSQLEAKVIFNSGLAKNWDVHAIMGDLVSVEKEKVTTTPMRLGPFLGEPAKAEGQSGVVWPISFEGLEESHVYQLRIQMRPKTAMKMEAIEAVRNAIQADKDRKMVKVDFFKQR